MYGLLTDLNFSRHWIFTNYYLGLKNVLGENKIKLVTSSEDLQDVHTLFIGDEHHAPNKLIWMDEDFINQCNLKNIKVIILNNEKIYNSAFPWNENIQTYVCKFNNYHQLVYDTDDAATLRAPINKTFMSRSYKNTIKTSNNKKNRAVFIGAGVHNEPSYEKRKQLLDTIQNYIPIDIIPSDPSRSMVDYLHLISTYRYILSPLGNASSVTMRYYESLFVNSIPLQQTTEGITSAFANEIKARWGIFFTDGEDLVSKLKNQEPLQQCDYYMEDFINDTIVNLIQ